jgi:hypothetical protein
MTRDLKDTRDNWRDALDEMGALESPLLTRSLVSDRGLCADHEAIVDWIPGIPKARGMTMIARVTVRFG